MTRALAFAVVFLAGTACHLETKRDLRIDEQDKTAKTAESEVTETKKQDASEVDTKTTKSENAVVVQETDGSSEVVRVPRDKPLALKKGAKVIGTVPLAQTVVDQQARIGAKVDDKTTAKKSTETDDKTVKTAAKTDDSAGFGFSTKFYLLAGGLLAAVVALGLFLSHSKLVRRLLGVPL